MLPKRTPWRCSSLDPGSDMRKNTDNWNYSRKSKHLASLASYPDSLRTVVYNTQVLLESHFAPEYFRSSLKVPTDLLCSLLLWRTPWPKTTWGEKGEFHFTAHSPSRREARAGVQGRNSLAYAHPASLYNPGPSAWGWYHTQWAGLSCISQQSHKHHRHAYRPIWWRQSHRWDSTDNSGLCQVDSWSCLELHLRIHSTHRKASLAMLNVSLALTTCF